MAIAENGEFKTETSGTNNRRFEDDSYAYIVMEKFHNVYLLFCLFIQCLVAEINKYPSKVIDSSARTLPRRQPRNLTSSASSSSNSQHWMPTRYTVVDLKDVVTVNALQT
ncbi:hypothetical protein CCACVL1_26671 [Corchorus capsularis]|uniref:Uncharacterized protein n=1 Tax=Corchorus capsularis TaxID=210143 RepID=A0A1R3GDX0_COCAP|nr:hypothetical protein CCACVL1_26671 [Corchorus capsularis]